MDTSLSALRLRILLALVVMAGLAYWVQTSHDHFVSFFQRSAIARAPLALALDTARTEDREPEAIAAGVPTGVTLTAINGAPYAGGVQWFSSIDQSSPGDTLLLGWRDASGNAHESAIRLAADTRPPVRAARFWRELVLYDVVPLICMLTGYWVVFAKPRDPNTWLVLGLLLFSQTVFTPHVGLAYGGWLEFRDQYSFLLQIFAPLALLPFAVGFPERSRLDARAPWAKYLLIVPAFLCGCISFAAHDAGMFSGSIAAPFRATAHYADQLCSACYLLELVLYFLVLGDKLRSSSRPDVRRRLSVLLIGTGIGIAFLLTIFVLLPAFGWDPEKPGHFWADELGGTAFLLAPMSLAYVVLAQRAMDVRMLLRQGTRYAMARVSLWIGQVVLIGYASYALLGSVFSHAHPAAYPVLNIVAFLAILGLVRFALRNKSRAWLDRRFFREAYDSEQVLTELTDQVRHHAETGPLFEVVARTVSATLHVRVVAMFVREGKQFCLEHGLGLDAQELAAVPPLPGGSSLVRKLASSRAAARVYGDSQDAWFLLASAADRAMLERLHVELLLPLTGRTRLMGIMALGPKQSEAPYSATDLRLLEALALQAGIALEVGEMAKSLAREAAQRERSNRELELAREVQERFFPQQMPELPSGSVAGFCRPALTVGGDYYDVFPLVDGRIAIAIGDISGKGVSAALLMASLRASLRGITMESGLRCNDLVSRLNGLIYEASASHRYATFFLAIYDPGSCALECVNAGHNPPLLVRRRVGEEPQVELIAADGPVIGLFAEVSYSVQQIALAPGDMLITYTDGISEAMSSDGQEWGEARLTTAALALNGHPADHAITTILAEADAFTSGADQYDDMTLLVLKLDHAETDA